MFSASGYTQSTLVIMKYAIIADMLQKLREKYRYSVILLKELVKTDFKLRYEGSVLGVLWSALKPLLLFAVMYVVFVHFLRFGYTIDPVTGESVVIPFFAVALLLAIVLWNFFQETTSQGMMSIVSQSDILRKINIPKYIVVVSASMSALINLGINLVVLLVFALISGVQFGPTVLLMIPIIIELYIFSLAVAMILAALYVKFRDLSHIWEVVMQAAYFGTPIIYPLSMIMAMSVTAGKVLLLSPMAQIIQDARLFAIYNGNDTLAINANTVWKTDVVWNTIGNPLLMIVPLLLVIATAIVAVLYFRKASKRFTELV
jgi:ABC-2 type transport system permease protein